MQPKSKNTSFLFVGSLAIMCIFAPASQALAGDKALLVEIGFNNDASLYAFAQYGIQDGSGFPYADLVVIEAKSDSYVTDITQNVVITSEQDSGDAAWVQLRSSAFGKLQARGFSPEAVNRAATINLKPSATAERDIMPGVKANASTISFPLAGSVDCASFGASSNGQATEIRINNVSVAASVDSRVPKSRGCPQYYGIAKIDSKTVRPGVVAVAAVLQFDKHGFEGPDTRYMAIVRHVSVPQ